MAKTIGIVVVALLAASTAVIPAAVITATGRRTRWAATRFVAEHASEFGVDANRIVVGGDSAGANMAAVICQHAKQTGKPTLALQVLLCPGVDMLSERPSRREFAEGYFIEEASMGWFIEQVYPADLDLKDPRMSPIYAADLTGLPPAHIHTAEFDPLRDDGRAYAERLEAAGVEVRYTCHPGMIHHFYCMAGTIPYAREAVNAMGSAIKAALA